MSLDKNGIFVVTGGTGHLGATLVRQLLQSGRRVRLVDYKPSAAVQKKSTGPVGHAAIAGLEAEFGKEQFEIVSGDVCDLKSLVDAFAGAECVFHLAAVISIVGDLGGLLQDVNVQGAANAADACLETGVKRMVHISSVHAFQMSPKDEPLTENRARVPEKDGAFNAYDRSKAGGERAVRARLQKGLDAVIIHPTGVIGPYDFQPSRMGQVWLDLAQQKMPSLVEGGFNWVDVRDVCNSIRKAADVGKTGRSYLLGGHQVAIAELASLAESITAQKAPSWVCPMWLAKLGAPSMELFSRIFQQQPLYTRESLEALQANEDMVSDLAIAELGHQARPTKETIRDCYRFFIAQNRLEQALPHDAFFDENGQNTEEISVF